MAADRLGVSRRTIPNLVKAGSLTPDARAGGQYLFAPSTIDALAARRAPVDEPVSAGCDVPLFGKGAA